MVPDWFVTLAKTPQIIATLLTILTTVVLKLAQPRPKVVWGTSHGFTFRIPNPQGNESLLHTQTIFLQNICFGAARDIEIILNYKPDNFSLWPQLNYSTTTNPENRFVIKIENLGRREFTSVEMLHGHGSMPATLRVRSSLGQCRQLPLAPMRVYPKKVAILFGGLCLIGLYTVFNALVSMATR